MADVLAWWSPEAWQAIAAWAALGGGLVALLVARGQLVEARRIRLEQAQPQVVVYFDLIASIFLELVIKNIGPTVAVDIDFTFEPPLQSTIWGGRDENPAESKMLTEGMPTLVPGMQHRLLFERGPDLVGRPDLPRCYDVTVNFKDTGGRSHTQTYRLDLEMFFAGSQIRPKNIEDVAKQLERIANALGR